MASNEQDQKTRGGSGGWMTEEEAQRIVKRYKCPEGGRAGCARVYDDTADAYDQCSQVLRYTAPRQVAKVMCELYQDSRQRMTVRILDVAAGTGHVGVELHKLGFRQLEALDPSQAMLDVAATKGVYSRLMKEFMTDKQLPMEDNSYDSIVICGSANHIPVSALNEMIRLVTAGGFIVNVMRSEYLTEDFGKQLTRQMEDLEKAGHWKQVTRRTFACYARDIEGVVFTHQVL